jgi:8-oxo-dGTP diphosphatase
MQEIRVGRIVVVLDQARVVEPFDAVVVVLFSADKLVLVRDERRAWEFPGGHREGDESYEETAVREVHEEAGARITGVEYLGYYTALAGQVTAIACAEVACFEGAGGGCEPSEVALFDELPSDLSFGDGREQLFLDCARAFRACRGD